MLRHFNSQWTDFGRDRADKASPEVRPRDAEVCGTSTSGCKSKSEQRGGWERERTEADVASSRPNIPNAVSTAGTSVYILSGITV